MNILSTMNKLQEHGMTLPPEVKSRVKVQNAREVLFQTMSYILSLEGKKFEWLPEYEQVAEWLEDDKGKGLLLYGHYGRGKTLLTKYALPMILLDKMGLVMRTYDMREMQAKVDDILSYRRPIGLDDIGTEDILNDFGSKREVFSEIIDYYEKIKGLVVITTNLNKNELIERYGERVFERIISTTRRVVFKGNSLRS